MFRVYSRNTLKWRNKTVPVRLQLFLGREDVDVDHELLASKILIEMHLLHHITATIFFPKTGMFDFVSQQELLVMFHIMQQLPLNLSHLIIKQMQEACKRAREPLALGMVLIQIF